MRTRVSARLILVIVLVHLVSAGVARAYAINLTTDWDGLYAPGLGDTIAVSVWLDTEGNPDGIIGFSVGIEFDPGTLAYDQAASSSSTYLLYMNTGFPPTPYLVPLGCCAAGEGPNPWPAYPSQINVDWGSTGLGSAQVAPIAGGGLLATLVFEVVDTGDGIPEIFINWDTQRGNVFLVTPSAVDISDQVTTTGSPIDLGWGICDEDPTDPVCLPEPSMSLLLASGVVGLAWMARRRS